MFIISTGTKAQWWRGNTHEYPQSIGVAPARYPWKYTIKAHMYWMVTAGQYPFKDVSHSNICQTDILKKQLERKQFGTNLDMDTTGRTLSQGDKQLLTFLTLPGEKWTFVRDKCNLHVLLRSPAKHDQHICNEKT